MPLKVRDVNLSRRVKELRRQRGVTQEILAEDSGLSLRTIQRIENNETTPRGESLRRLALALNTTPDEIIDWKIQEDKGYLILMSLSALGFLFFPILGIVIPLIFWILKKDKVRNVDKIGKSILNFEITWSIMVFAYLLFLIIGVVGEVVTQITPAGILKSYIPVVALYCYNVIVILVNTIRISKRKNVKYIPSFIIFK